MSDTLKRLSGKIEAIPSPALRALAWNAAATYLEFIATKSEPRLASRFLMLAAEFRDRADAICPGADDGGGFSAEFERELEAEYRTILADVRSAFDGH